MKKIFFTLGIVLSLFPYSSEPLDTFDGKALICRALGLTFGGDDSIKGPKPWGRVGNTYWKEEQVYFPKDYRGFKFIENTVSIDRIIAGSIERKITDIKTVKPYEATWCAETQTIKYENKFRNDPGRHTRELVQKEVEHCVSSFTLKRDTAYIFQVWTEYGPSGHLNNDLSVFPDYYMGRSQLYACDVEENLKAYDNFLINLQTKEKKRIENIEIQRETQRLERLKKRKL